MCKAALTYLTTSLLLTLSVSAIRVSAAIHCVSSETELQTALAISASNGEDDTILVVEGTYVGQFTYLTGATGEASNLSLEGGYTTASCVERVVDATRTVLDGDGRGTVLTLDVIAAPGSLNTPDVSIEALTLRNGAVSSSGGGLRVSGNQREDTLGQVQVRNNVLLNNAAGGIGGGVFVANAASVTLSDNQFAENIAASGGGVAIIDFGTLELTANAFSANTATLRSGTFGGGGAYVDSGAVANVTGNRFAANEATSHGGGAWVTNLTQALELNDNDFSGNSTQQQDGGGAAVKVLVATATVAVVGNSFSQNRAGPSGDGGGLRVIAPSITLSGNGFYGNVAESGGGAAFFDYDALRVVNNAFSGNLASGELGDVGGGGAYMDPAFDSQTTWTNNSCSGNTAASAGGGLRLRLDGSSERADLYNNIVWNNSAAEANDLWIDNDGDGNGVPSTVELLANDFDQSAQGFFINLPILIDASNLNENPRFVEDVDPLTAPTADGDLHLQMGVVLSPVLDMGRLDAPELLPDDIEGEARIFGAGVDIGADEAVDTDGDGVPDYADNCITAPNGPLLPDAGGNIQLDTDGDGWGNSCDGDLDNDGFVSTSDLVVFRDALFSASNEDADFDGDGFVTTPDLVLLQQMLFSEPGPSGLTSTR